jgi:hypothetical protein
MTRAPFWVSLLQSDRGPSGPDCVARGRRAQPSSNSETLRPVVVAIAPWRVRTKPTQRSLANILRDPCNPRLAAASFQPWCAPGRVELLRRWPSANDSESRDLGAPLAVVCVCCKFDLLLGRVHSRVSHGADFGDSTGHPSGRCLAVRARARPADYSTRMWTSSRRHCCNQGIGLSLRGPAVRTASGAHCALVRAAHVARVPARHHMPNGDRHRPSLNMRA